MLVESWHLLQASHEAPSPQLRAAWHDLSGRSLVPAGANAPDLALAAAQRIPGACITTVRQDGRLLLAMAMKNGRSLVTPLGNSGLPHVDSHMAEAALAALLKDTGRPLTLTGIPGSGPFWQALTKSSGQLAVIDRWERAGLELRCGFETWFEGNFDRKRRKEYRRLEARLLELPEARFDGLGVAEDVSPWIDDLLRIEASGWKGRRGTALADDAAMSEALREGLAALHARQQLRFWRIAVEGRTIATLYAIMEAGQAWLGKIAYDESFGRYSPGVLLILEATERLFAEGGIQLADSCAIPGHPMIDHIWRDRLVMVDVMVAGPGVSGLRFAAQLAIERLRRKLRSAARDAYYRLKGWHRS